MNEWGYLAEILVLGLLVYFGSRKIKKPSPPRLEPEPEEIVDETPAVQGVEAERLEEIVIHFDRFAAPFVKPSDSVGIRFEPVEEDEELEHYMDAARYWTKRRIGMRGDPPPPGGDIK